MRPSWSNARNESARRDAALVADHRRRRQKEGPHDGDQYNFTDPQLRIMKSSTHVGYAQDYNVQVAVDQASLLIVGCTLSNHPNDSQEAEPTLAAIPSEIGTPEAATLDAGYFGPATLTACAKREIDPYIATGRDPPSSKLATAFCSIP